jgi:hypothetical protein
MIAEARVSLSERRPLPRILMYIDEACGYCRAELDRWAATAVSSPALFKGIEVAVVTATPLKRKSLVPSVLPHRRLRDEDGIIADALNARMVPLLAVMNESGVVERVKIGQNSSAEIVAWLEFLQHRTK